MPFWLKLCPGFLEPNLCENPPTHTRRSWRPRQTTGEVPSRVQGGRGKVVEATGGHPGGQGNPRGSGRIGKRHGGRVAARDNGPRIWDSRMERMGSTPRPRPSRRCASFRQFGWQPTWSGGATKVTTRRARRARQRLPWRSCLRGHAWDPEAEVGVPR